MGKRLGQENRPPAPKKRKIHPPEDEPSSLPASQESPRKPKRKGIDSGVDRFESDTPPFFDKAPSILSRRSSRRSLSKVADVKEYCDCGSLPAFKLWIPSLSLLRHSAEEYRGKLNWICFSEERATAVVNRASLVNFLLHCTRQIGAISPYTFHLAISTMDRVMFRILRHGTPNAKERVERDQRILAAACLTISSRIEDVHPVHVDDIVIASRKMFTSSQTRVWENRILQVLDFEVNVPTTLDFLQRFLMEEKSVLSDSCWKCSKPKEPKPITIFNLAADTWNPSYSEGRNKSPVEAICAFLAEVFIAHPVSLGYTCDSIAVAIIKAVVAILVDTARTRDHSDLPALADLLPESVLELVTDEEEAADALSSVLVVYFEHSSVSVKTTKSNFAQINESLKRWEADSDMVQEAIEAENPREKACKLSAYLGVWCHERKISITMSDAADVVQRFLLDGGKNDLGEHLKRFQAHKQSSHKCTTEPIVQDVLKVEVQEPSHQTSQFPTGYFAYDVNWKHLDAFRFFDELFVEWCGDMDLIQSLETSGRARDALLRAKEQYDLEERTPLPSSARKQCGDFQDEYSSASTSSCYPVS